MCDQDGSRSGAAPDAKAPLRHAGFVVAILGDEVFVNVDGILRRAAAAPELRLRVGDRVSIGDAEEPDRQTGRASRTASLSRGQTSSAHGP